MWNRKSELGQAAYEKLVVFFFGFCKHWISSRGCASNAALSSCKHCCLLVFLLLVGAIDSLLCGTNPLDFFFIGDRCSFSQFDSLCPVSL
jgi:hypothetical protein